MRTYVFLAQRFFTSKERNLRYATPIIRIATAGVSIGVLVMLVSIAVSQGFKQEIRDNVAAANAHLKVLPIGYRENPEKVTQFPEALVNTLQQLPGITYAHGILYQPVLLESEGSLHGLLLKGLGGKIPDTFESRFLQEGNMPLNDASASEICISENIANSLKLSVGAPLNAYITNQGKSIRKRRFRVSGIFKTGIPGIDMEVAFASLPAIQNLNDGVPKLFIAPGEKQLEFKSNLDARIALYRNGNLEQRSALAIPKSSVGKDTLAIAQQVGAFTDSLVFTLFENNVKLLHDARPEFMAYQGLELFTPGFKNLEKTADAVYEAMPFDYELITVKEDFPEIFNWLELLNTNVIVLLVIMAVVSLVNMASALLVLIIEKTQAIALLKTMGGSNLLIRKTFLTIAGIILYRGLLWGNIVFGLVYFIQTHYQIMKLDASQYYVSFVPLEINALQWVGTNVLTLVFCLIVLILPTVLISRIYPAKALRIE